MSATRRKIAADRIGAPAAWIALAAASAAMSLMSAAQVVAFGNGAGGWAPLGGAVAGFLGVIALQSFTVRSTVRWLVVLSVAMVARFGSAVMDDPGQSSAIVAWAIATTVALVVATSSPKAGWSAASGPTRERAGFLDGAGLRGTLRIAVAVACLAAAAGLGLGPVAAGTLDSALTVGDPPVLSAAAATASLISTEQLDATSRPRLSNQVVLRVSGPDSGFLRSQTFDRWNGQAWTRTVDQELPLGPDGSVRHVATDEVADDAPEFRQEIEVVASVATALPAAPEAISVEAAVDISQRADGTLTSNQPFGSGARYVVRSRRRTDLTPQLLRAASGTLPEPLASRVVEPGPTTARVRDLAASIVANASTDYDKVLAVENWLGTHTKYSIDAPTSPRDRDPVDDFLFRAKLGWCEQIATSATTLLRLAGVPARVATGYVVSERDPISRKMIVRSRDAHAWTEVWFAGVGWVPFDPTASVPLSGELPPRTTSSSIAVVLDIVTWLLLAVGLVAALGPWLLDVIRGRTRRSARARSGRGFSTWFGRRPTPTTWAAIADERLDRMGAQWGRTREPFETTTVYAKALADLSGEDSLAGAGAMVDRDRYAPESVDDATRDRVDAALASAAAVSPRSRS